MQDTDATTIEEKPLSPYDLVKILYEDRGRIYDIEESVLSRNAFMVNRIMSIQSPELADRLQRVRCGAKQMFFAWCALLEAQGVRRTPDAVYTKGRKKLEQELKPERVQIPSEDMMPLSRFTGVEYKTILSALASETHRDLVLRAYDEMKEHEKRVAKPTAKLTAKEIKNI